LSHGRRADESARGWTVLITSNAAFRGTRRTEGLEASLNTPESLAAAVDHSGEPDDPAAAVIFLLSDGGTYIPGTTICVVGGGFDAPVPLKASAN
jgi:NAD(P)-dependent dehydrogenase (short-subunit alcohol dehydrogenase family)